MQVLYALTAGVAGYVASLCYKVMGGTNWVRNVLLTTALFCGPMLACFSFLNTVAIIYRVSGTPIPCPQCQTGLKPLVTLRGDGACSSILQLCADSVTSVA